MAIIILKGKLSEKDFEKAKEDYKTYIKITLDMKRKKVALGGEYHFDAEQLLLKAGSKQKDIWGGGVDLKGRRVETNGLLI